MDRIILLFDAHKLDISDEFSEVIKALKNHEDKIRVVLNKADQIETQQLMRVYGALMWSLGKIINTPEVVRVYIGSFWSHPLLIPDNRKLFEAEEQDLFKDIQSLPRNAALRKLNDLIKRARLAKVEWWARGARPAAGRGAGVAGTATGASGSGCPELTLQTPGHSRIARCPNQSSLCTYGCGLSLTENLLHAHKPQTGRYHRTHGQPREWKWVGHGPRPCGRPFPVLLSTGLHAGKSRTRKEK